MKVWIGDPAPQDVAWVSWPSAVMPEERAGLIRTIEHYGINAFMVDLYSVDDMFWVQELDAGAAILEKQIGVEFHVNVHVHSDNQEVIDFINASKYLEYVPLVGV